MPGFRISVLLQGFTGIASDKKKCLVFIEDRWTKIGDFMEHIKRVFCVKRVEVFIDDCWVSSEEPICIIKPSDIIMVREVIILPELSTNALKRPSCEEDLPEKKEKRPKKKKVEHSPVRTVEEPDVVDDVVLAAKKEELLKKVEATLSPEEMDVTDDASQPTKKRRHRKRPSKKRKEYLERLSVGATLLSCMTQQTDDTPHSAPAPEVAFARPTSSHHIKFDEESFQGNSDNTMVEVDAPKEDWQERLLALREERKKHVFVRTETVNGRTSDLSICQNDAAVPNGLNGCAKVNGNSASENGIYDGCLADSVDACHTSYTHNSVPTETAKANDVVYFKRLTVVDGKPQVSDHLLALVEEVDESGAVALKIFEGNAEQTFTPDEIQDSEDGCFIVKVDWRHIIEPRLIVDASLLSKYL